MIALAYVQSCKIDLRRVINHVPNCSGVTVTIGYNRETLGFAVKLFHFISFCMEKITHSLGEFYKFHSPGIFYTGLTNCQ